MVAYIKMLDQNSQVYNDLMKILNHLYEYLPDENQ